MANLGYARVLSDEQILDEQVKVLEKYGCDKIYTDNRSGKSTERDGLKAMLEYARERDVVIVYKLSRLATSIGDLQQIANELKEREIGLISISQGIDTSTENSGILFDMIALFAEFENEIISERIRSGLHNAKEKGIKLGRKEADTTMKEEAYQLYVSGDYTMREITETTGLSRATIYRYIDRKKSSGD